MLSRSKTHSKRGNLNALKRKAIPCCPTKGSVSTWAPESALNKKLVQPGSVVIHVFLLIRWVKSIVFGIWQSNQTAQTVVNRSRKLGKTTNGVPSVLELTIYESVKIDGTKRTRKKVTIKQVKRTIIGVAAYLSATTNVLLEKPMETRVTGVTRQPNSPTIKMGTGVTVSQRTSNVYANDATKSMHTIVLRTFLSSETLQRYSQYPRKLGINTLSYGEGPKKLAHSLGITVPEAQVKIEDYFRPYPKVRQFIQNTHRDIRECHMVRTVTGRPRRFPTMETLGYMTRWEMNGMQKGELARAERQAVNSRIQGSAADVARRAMILCEFDQQLANLGVQMLLQIHDELIFEVPEESIKEALPIIKHKMEHPFPYDLSVPLDCDGGSGYSWAAAKG